jgi:outer membrane biosynthesis protein TonB
MTRILSIIGLIGLIGALVGAALLGTRAFPRADLTTNLNSEALLPQSGGAEAAVSQPDSAASRATFTDTLADDSLIIIGLSLLAAAGIALLASILKTAFATQATRIGCFVTAGIGTLVIVLAAGVGVFWLATQFAPAAAPVEETAAEEPAAEETEEAVTEEPTEEAAEEPTAEEAEEEAEEPTPTPRSANTPAPTPTPTIAVPSPPEPDDTSTPPPTEGGVTPVEVPTEQEMLTETAVPQETQTGADQQEPVRSVIEVEWPMQMEVNRSDSVRIMLIRISEEVYVPTVEVAGNTVEAATPIPLGTPGAPIEEAFGRSYHAFATASLIGTTFDIERASPGRRSLEQDRIVWEWNLMPTTKGPQTLNANIIIEWEPDDGGSTIERQIWRARLDTTVRKPLLPTRNVGLLTTIGGVLGSGFTIPWIFDRLQDFVFGRIQDWLYDRAKEGVKRRAQRRAQRKRKRPRSTKKQ